MEPTENPYAILGVSPGASARDIRSAYRKAALLHHPDKKTDFQEKQKAHEQFAKISAAYEMLTSPDQQPMDSSSSHNMHSRQSYPSRFHDPFEVFEHVFREEFGNCDMRNPGPFGRSRDSFFREPFFGRGSPHRSSFDMGDPFGDDFFPSFGRPFGRNSLFENSLFGRDDDSDIFSSMREQMRKLEEQAQFNDEGDANKNSNKRMFTSSSSSTRSVRQANGETVTTTKRTQTVNGKTEQVEETVVYGADGSVKERKITGNDSLLENSRSDHRWLPNPQQQERERDPPPSSWWRRKAIKPDNSDQERNSRL
jgi:curved DNA-binding protein CbpA